MYGLVLNLKKVCVKVNKIYFYICLFYFGKDSYNV